MKKILIANRAEIACRIIATARAMGIKTIAIYAENDSTLPFTTLADEAYSLGAGTLADTYLNKKKVIEIARTAGADAIHPGYGFLSENAEFCRMVTAADIRFIGPKADTIALMGDKIASRVTAREAGVPLIPGSDHPTLEAAVSIGFPVLIKASAGGGGKGMRIVERVEDFAHALESAQDEAKSAFGDGRVYLEKYITHPRHIEVQVFSDSHGNHVHLFERECSIQRRHQKIVEETPSPALDASTRQRICDTAVMLARHIGYLGAGTVEFILDPQKQFYFLEMNTRLQVEHPITELVTGQDLVAWQIRVARGEKLPLTQGELHQTGHAMEVRIYAEDADRGFLPTTGTLTYIGMPTVRNARLDNGYVAGNQVTVHYDPMLAKLAIHADTREAAAEVLAVALDETYFSGLKTNRAYLQRILRHPAFLEGKTDTAFVQTHADSLKAQTPALEEKAYAIAALLNRGLAKATTMQTHATPTPWESLNGFRNVPL